MDLAMSRDAQALATVISKALEQDGSTPSDERLSYRLLLQMSLPLLQHLAEQDGGPAEPGCQGRNGAADPGTGERLFTATTERDDT